MLEFVMNKNGLGNQIYNDTNKRMGDAYLGGDNVPDWYKGLAIYMAEATNGSLDVSPNSLYFFANSYVDGPARIVDALGENLQALRGRKDFDSNMWRKVPVVGSFIGAASNVDAREFASIERQILAMDAKIKMFSANNVNQLSKYIEANPDSVAVVEVYDKTVGALNQLRTQRNLISSLDLPPKEKARMLKDNKDNQNLYKYHLVQMFKSLNIKP